MLVDVKYIVKLIQLFLVGLINALMTEDCEGFHFTLFQFYKTQIKLKKFETHNHRKLSITI